MIDAMRTYSQHTLLSTVVEGVPAFIDSLTSLVNRVASNIIVQIVITAPLLYLHPNLFALGFVVGFVFDKQVRLIVEKVNVVYAAKRPLFERVLLFGGGSFLALLTMPTSMIAATLYYSSQWGASLYQNSVNRDPKKDAATLNVTIKNLEINLGASEIFEETNEPNSSKNSISDEKH